jgi:hypothetical protein
VGKEPRASHACTLYSNHDIHVVFSGWKLHPVASMPLLDTILLHTLETQCSTENGAMCGFLASKAQSAHH